MPDEMTIITGQNGFYAVVGNRRTRLYISVAAAQRAAARGELYTAHEYAVLTGQDAAQPEAKSPLSLFD
jgi:hypothetical protein